MPPKPSSKRASRPATPSGGATAIIAIVLLAIFGILFLVTGADPLGIFTEGTTTAPQATLALPADTGNTSGSSTDWEVYFTDPNTINNPEDLTGSIPEILIQYIETAQTSIHIAAFEFNLTPVAQALIAAKKRGVDVRWVTDDEHGIEADTEDGRGQFAMLKKANIPVRDDGRSALMHNKFIIFDGATVWTGSTNLTVNGNFRNNNNVIVLHSPQIAAIYEREFNEMWNGEFGPTSPTPTNLNQQAVNLNGMPVQILFAAEDRAIEQIIPLIESAQSSIRFMAFSFTHSALGDAMLARAADGVEVAGIFETRGSETEYSELRPMYCARLSVRQDGNPGTFHHKVIIIDEKIVITGSLNFSDNANTSNDENVVILTNPQIAKLYLQEFSRRWDEATRPDPADMNCK
ncbi:MAG: phospholipase D-like domain-containing protein [Anaerolineales bacterium]